MANMAIDELVAMISSILHRNGPDMEITTLVATVYSANPNARALMKTAGGAKRWLEQHPSAFQLFRPQPNEQPLVWSVRPLAPVDEVASVSEVEIVLEKPHKDSSLGILLSGDGHPYIDEVASGALAHGKLLLGDQVLLVNGWDAAGHTQTAKRFVQLTGVIRIRVLRRAAAAEEEVFGSLRAKQAQALSPAPPRAAEPIAVARVNSGPLRARSPPPSPSSLPPPPAPPAPPESVHEGLAGAAAGVFAPRLACSDGAHDVLASQNCRLLCFALTAPSLLLCLAPSPLS